MNQQTQIFAVGRRCVLLKPCKGEAERADLWMCQNWSDRWRQRKKKNKDGMRWRKVSCCVLLSGSYWVVPECCKQQDLNLMVCAWMCKCGCITPVQVKAVRPWVDKRGGVYVMRPTGVAGSWLMPAGELWWVAHSPAPNIPVKPPRLDGLLSEWGMCVLCCLCFDLRHVGAVSNYVLGSGGVYFYVLYGIIIDYNCTLLTSTRCAGQTGEIRLTALTVCVCVK